MIDVKLMYGVKVLDSDSYDFRNKSWLPDVVDQPWHSQSIPSLRASAGIQIKDTLHEYVGAILHPYTTVQCRLEPGRESKYITVRQAVQLPVCDKCNRPAKIVENAVALAHTVICAHCGTYFVMDIDTVHHKIRWVNRTEIAWKPDEIEEQANEILRDRGPPGAPGLLRKFTDHVVRLRREGPKPYLEAWQGRHRPSGKVSKKD